MKWISKNTKMFILLMVIIMFIANVVLMIIVGKMFPFPDGNGELMIGALIAWGGQLMGLIGLGVKEWFDGKVDEYRQKLNEND